MSRLLTVPRRRRTPSPPAAGLPCPDSVEVAARAVRVGQTWHRSLAVTGYPHEVGPGWLEPLLAHPAVADISLHIDPVPTPLAADRLRRQLARLESSRRVDADRGRLADPYVDAAADDARDLAERVARGQGRLFGVGLYVTLRAGDEPGLDEATSAVRGLLASLLCDARPATFRHLQGWTTTLPVGLDLLKARRTFDTAALAAAYPFPPSGLTRHGGVAYGIEARGKGLVAWDRFAADNYNAVVLARSGSGKSYLAKLEALRSLYAGVEVLVVDPEDEYRRLADATGGTTVGLGQPGVRVNPFDLDHGEDALARRAMFIHTLVAVLLGAEPDPEAKATLDRAVIAAYHHAGITADPRTHARPAPTLPDLVAVLAADDHPAGPALARRLAPYATGSHKGLLDGATTTRPDGHLVVFCLRDLPDELKTAGTLLVLDAIWRRVSDPAGRRPRLVVVDEAWLLMRDPAGARFLFRLAKAARKHWAGLTVVTQDAADLLGSELGQAVVANAATQILLRQAPQAIDAVADAFALSEGERGWLLAADRGEGVLAAGTDRVAFQAVASPAEHQLITTDPAELAELEGEGR